MQQNSEAEENAPKDPFAYVSSRIEEMRAERAAKIVESLRKFKSKYFTNYALLFAFKERRDFVNFHSVSHKLGKWLDGIICQNLESS